MAPSLQHPLRRLLFQVITVLRLLSLPFGSLNMTLFDISFPVSLPPSSGTGMGGLVALQASVGRLGGTVKDVRRRRLEANVDTAYIVDMDPDQYHPPDDATSRQLRTNVVRYHRATVSYGGRDALNGFLVLYSGTILGMTALLTSELTEGQVQLYIRVNGVDSPPGNADSIIFTTSTGKAQYKEFSIPIAVEPGNVVEIGVLESRFADDFAFTANVQPVKNAASVVIMMQH